MWTVVLGGVSVNWTLSSVSVPRPRSRASSASNDGGAMKMNRASSARLFTASAPCTSMSRRHVLPDLVAFCGFTTGVLFVGARCGASFL